jgi:hypothetical protein
VASESWAVLTHRNGATVCGSVHCKAETSTIVRGVSGTHRIRAECSSSATANRTAATALSIARIMKTN